MFRIALLLAYSSWVMGCQKTPVMTIDPKITESERMALSASDSIIAVKSSYYDQYFTRSAAYGWTGGDGATSFLLPDGNSFWLFGDSFVDTVYPDKHRPSTSFIHNSIVITDQFGKFQTLYGGTKESPKPFFDGVEPIQFWPGSGFANQQLNKIFVTLSTIEIIPNGGMWGFKVVGNTVGVLSWPDFKFQETYTFTNRDQVDWSSANFEENGYVYLYGAESVRFDKYVHVCRFPSATPYKQVQYFDGDQWVSDPTKSKRLLNGISQQYSFFKYKNKYYLLSQESLLGPTIYLWDAASPVGPFTNKRKIYKTPESKGNVITYNASAHPQLIVDDKLLVGYCTNSMGDWEIWKNADLYKPYFVWVSNWQ